GTHGAMAPPFELFGYDLSGDTRYFYVVLFVVGVMYLGATTLMRTRDGRALIAVRDHYLSAEMMGVNLTKYRTMAFGISSFYAGIGGALYAHYI
uniref:ABC transporter permease subunit n=1 Tax=Salmonella sp. s50237 TaxID=3159649 RepID=UPI00397EE6A4